MTAFLNALYLSMCEVERADANKMGYERVCQHPVEVGILGPDDLLVIDFNFISFGDTAAAVRLARAAVRNGVPVGIHTYHASPALRELLAEPLVVVAETHRKVRAKLRRLIANRVPVAARVPVLAVYES